MQHTFKASYKLVNVYGVNVSENEKPAQRRLIMPTKPPQAVASNISITPTPQTLLTDALSIIATEIANMKYKAKPGSQLDLAEARVLTGYLKCLAEISREMREHEAKMQDYSKMSNEQLLELAMKLQSQIEAKPATPIEPETES